VQGASRFVQRLWRLVNESATSPGLPRRRGRGVRRPMRWRLRKAAHGALDKVSTASKDCIQRLPRLYPGISNALGDVLAREGQPSPELAWAIARAAVILVNFSPQSALQNSAQSRWISEQVAPKQCRTARFAG